MDIYTLIIPTGIGASIGGYAGDAGHVARKLSEKFKLIVNPNVVNAAGFSAINDNMLYVEGYALDLFFKKEIALRPSKKNKIGVLFDKAIPENMLNIHINTLNAMKMVYGIDTIFEITQEEVGIEFIESSAGISTGNIKNPDALILGAKSLIQKGCNALAPVCFFEDSEDENYANGNGIDIVGGVEAIISHLLTKTFLLPCAHAPAFRDFEIANQIISPKAASEYITPTFLPCIILGLYNAPQLVPFNVRENGDILLNDTKGLIMPYNALGSIPVLKSIENNIPVYAIRENKTVLNITNSIIKSENIINLKTYNDLLKQI